MTERIVIQEEKQRITLESGLRLVASKRATVTDEMKKSLDAMAQSASLLFGKEVYAVYINDDRDTPGSLHSIVIKFETTA